MTLANENKRSCNCAKTRYEFLNYVCSLYVPNEIFMQVKMKGSVENLALDWEGQVRSPLLPKVSKNFTKKTIDISILMKILKT